MEAGFFFGFLQELWGGRYKNERNTIGGMNLQKIGCDADHYFRHI